MKQRRLVLASLSFSVLLNVFLTVELRRARAVLAPTSFLSGNIAPAVTLVSANGVRTTVSVAGNRLPTLFYWSRPTCYWCERDLPNFEAIAAQARDRYRILAVSASSPAELAEYAKAHHLLIPLYSMDSRNAQEYRLVQTPTTLLVSERGALLKRWVGSFRSNTRGEVEKALGIALPAEPISEAGN